MEQRSVLEALMRGGEICRSRDLVREGVATATIQRALAAGWLEKVSRGTYRRKGAAFEDGEALAELAARAPGGVVCLHSAAAWHALGEAHPHLIWMAVPHARRPPAVEWPRVRWVRWRREAAFRAGIIDRSICGVRVRITGPARTVIDMLDPRCPTNRDDGLRVLRDYLREGGSRAELKAMARSMAAGASVISAVDMAEILTGPT